MKILKSELNSKCLESLLEIVKQYDEDQELLNGDFEIHVESIEPPKILYHYTSVNTLLTILEKVENKKIILRGTHVKYLNDYSEFSYGTQVLNELIKDYEDQNPGIEIKSDKITENDWMNYSNPDLFGLSKTFFTSFSSNQDNLPMWNLYGDSGKGVSIGFDIDQLNTLKNIKNNSFKWAKCKYGKKEFKKRLYENKKVGEILYKIFDFNKKSRSYFGDINPKGVFYALCQYKDPAYDYEKEYRLIRTSRDAKISIQNELSKPYVENEIPTSAIKEIVIGPCKDLDLTKNTIEIALQNAGIAKKDVEIIQSKAPFRKI
jgi:hypothetical protein